MNWFDIVVVIALIMAFFKGIQKGLIVQLVSLVGLVAAIFFAGQLAKNILPWLLQISEIPTNVASVLSYIMAFGLIMAVVTLIGNAIQKLIEAVHLSFLNKILGAVISLGISMVILSLILNLVLMIDPNEKIIKKDIRENSFFYEKIQMVVPAIVPYLNNDAWKQYVPEKYRNQIENADRTTEETDSPETPIINM